MLQRKLRRNHMTPIARIARAELPVAPEVESLRMPKGRPTAEKLAAHAEGMAKAAAPLADTFVSAGLPPDFIARLNAASGALVEAVNERTQHRGRQNGATTGLKRKLSSARKLVHVLDAFVQTALEGDETLLANWDIVKRVRRTTNKPLPPVTPIASASVQT
jgi:hypothetical protein